MPHDPPLSLQDKVRLLRERYANSVEEKLIEISAAYDRLVGEKDARSYTEQTRDMHEADRDYLTIVTEVYGDLARSGGQAWLTVDPLDDNGKLRPPSDIAAAIWADARFSELR